ncbi:hypothetical protein Bca4012_078113 [Brassica carinata]|uniref:Uncharacterized protein n=2 Tax=Brassica TaxID=3705 RepID=A0A3P6EP79_BRAOL|nr:PREDICTED: uncharacterized protein LOC106301494 [Brassica oleracea var. oleracea]CAF1994528.1 unnamed protein product [Brassica napus]VDD37991.1 unnamed protein product [Brassica oleracea]
MDIFFEKNLQSLMETMEQQRHSLSSVPMLSRLDHLDFVTNNLERQQNLAKWKGESSSITRGLIDRGMMVREAHFKGSLLDRIATLETRLFQLESSNASSTSIGESGETSSQRIKRDLTKTLPIFNSNINPFHTPLQHPQDPRETETKIKKETEKEINIEKSLLENKKKNFANETCKPKKKTKSPKKWSRCNLLGC